MSPFRRIHPVAGTTLFLIFLCLQASAENRQLEIQGQLKVEGLLVEESDRKFQIKGRFVDELGRPVAIQPTLLRQASPVRFNWCSPSTLVGDTEAGTETTPANGEFCLEVEGVADLMLRASAPHYASYEKNLDTNIEQLAPTLELLSAPNQLFQAKQELNTVEVLTSSRAQENTRNRVHLELICAEEKHQLGVRDASGSPIARFEFLPPKRVSASECRFVANLSLNQKVVAATQQEVLLVSDVRLENISTQRAGKKEKIQVELAAHNGVINDGVVELRLNDTFVGGADVENGKATISLAISESTRILQVEYLPASPALLAPAPTSFEVPARKTSAAFSWAPLHVLALLSFTMWLAYAWLKPRFRSNEKVDSPLPKEASLISTANSTGPIRGRALDAHTGAPLPGTIILLFERSPTRLDLVEEKICDENGEFEFQSEWERSRLMVLKCKSTTYLTIESEVTAAQHTIFLPLRRRALISGLIKWAQKKGRPWDNQPLPTIEHVAKTAQNRGLQGTVEWTTRLAESAYGPTEPQDEDVKSLTKPTSDIP